MGGSLSRAMRFVALTSDGYPVCSAQVSIWAYGIAGRELSDEWQMVISWECESFNMFEIRLFTRSRARLSPQRKAYAPTSPTFCYLRYCSRVAGLTDFNVHGAVETRNIRFPRNPRPCFSTSTATMSYASRPTSGLMRPSSGLGHISNSQSSALQARINEKKLELESLKQLRHLSAGLAGQMQQLEEKLETLSNGTEAVAHVMANWHTVLRAVHMASSKAWVSAAPPSYGADGLVAKIPQQKQAEDGDEEEEKPKLPQTLVRIPISQAQAVQKEQQQQQQRNEAGE